MVLKRYRGNFRRIITGSPEGGFLLAQCLNSGLLHSVIIIKLQNLAESLKSFSHKDPSIMILDILFCYVGCEHLLDSTAYYFQQI